ncbi:MAG: SEC-C metal-binding domain-containing protein, partial [Mycobacterium sp.]|nr:SEC-C metal-binding domain-containing protein [Mycobacterium sp.]
MPTNNQPCRCDSALDYAACCGPLHRGERPAATAVALMRSRFAAFAFGDAS